MMYQGDVYQAFDFGTYSSTQLENLNDRVRILSGLYGLVRPFDKIEPYRLEMKTKLANSLGKDLYTFWGDKIALDLDKAAKKVDAPFVVNLASNEYAKAISSALKTEIIKVDFKEYKLGAYKTIGIFAKKARGEMTDFLIKEDVKTLAQLKSFNRNGYKFSKSLSSDSEIVFTRK